MAFAIRITAKTKYGEKVEIEPSWWNIKELKNKYDFIKEGDYYLDYYLHVNKQPFMYIMDSQEKYRNHGVYEYKSWITINNKIKAKLDVLIQDLQEDSKIEICIYEWETGL